MRTKTQETQSPGRAAVSQGIAGNGLREAIVEFGRAATERHIQPICAAYEGLRAAARHVKVEELFQIADKALGMPTRDIVLSAFSHRHCFMCLDGTVACEQCDATGWALQGGVCSNCDGLGAVTCSFCRGTGWADRDTVPRDLRRAVIAHQMHRVQRDLQKLSERMPEIRVENLRQLSDEGRRKLACWLMRLQARLRDLADAPAMQNTEQKLSMLTRADEIEACLQMLRQR